MIRLLTFFLFAPSLLFVFFTFHLFSSQTFFDKTYIQWFIWILVFWYFSIFNIMTINMYLGQWFINIMEKYKTLHLILYIERELQHVNSSGKVFWNRLMSLSFLVFCVFVSKSGVRWKGLKIKAILEQRWCSRSLYLANISNFHLSNSEKLKHLTQIGRRRGSSKQWRMRTRKLNCHNFCH